MAGGKGAVLGRLDGKEAGELGEAAVRLILDESGSSPPEGDSEREARVVSLAGAVVDACREGLAKDEVASFLEREHRIPTAAAARVAEALERRRASLSRAVNRATGSTCLPHLGSADWRLDLSKGKAGEVAEPVFHVNLRSADGSDLSSFACSIEEMQDLVSTLKDACLSAKRNERAYSS
ncbi:COMM domain-containing protein [Chloropicon primus]|uniref:COMM domain-containing protein 3 n=1 Tax=Chloropicon primus TaxID=1764295 RepID=A0A5B8MJV5_9CHLO|nr:hypothetical protein A3770_04p32070 [Chloropicon primus]UPQ99901.1 COMM domain-containing protein [Chloropicon primus]|eukprot:QDZ20689.1 hypothetical protein A3770_04p32070 [Chloropicon primus]